MTRADRVLTIGFAAMAIGVALAVMGIASRAWVIAAAGIAATLCPIPMIVVMMREKRRSASTPQTGRTPISLRSILGFYTDRIRQPGPERVRVVLGALVIVYCVFAFVVSIVMSSWSNALVFGVVAAALLVLSYVQGTSQPPVT